MNCTHRSHADGEVIEPSVATAIASNCIFHNIRMTLYVANRVICKSLSINLHKNSPFKKNKLHTLVKDFV